MDLDEVLEGELVAAREMVVELDQPGSDRPVRLLGLPFKLSRTPGDAARAPGPVLGQHTREVLSEAGWPGAEIDALLDAGAVAGPAEAVQSGTFMA